MILPLGTDRPLKRPTVITYWLIGVNVAVYVVGAIYGSPRISPEGFQHLFQLLWLDPEHLAPWQFLTYQFLHGGLLHLLANMLFLFVFGPNVEDRLGRWAFLGFYLVGGIVAGLSHFLFESSPVVGASGSIAAVTGAYLVLFPKTQIRIFLFFFFIGVFSIQAWWLIAFAIIKDLVFQGWGADEGVARLAHLGGYAFGAGASFILLWTGVLAREPYDLFSMGRQARRRRVFRELATSGKTAWAHEVSSKAKVRSAAKSSADEHELAEKRAEICRMVAEEKLDEAGEAWEKLMDARGEVALPRQTHLDLANHLFASQKRQSAAVAYDIFLKRHPSDRQAPQVRLMLALISARYLNDPVHAKALLSEVQKQGVPDDCRALASELTQELG